VKPPTLQANYFSTVSLVLAWRSSHNVCDSPPDLFGGRLLVYFPDAELCDGAAEAESNGFLDVHNCPPWDTWVGFFSDSADPSSSDANYLVAWIPAEFVELVSAGIAVNPEGCIAWLDTSHVSLGALLRNAN
jgi:hypothetical protein